MSVDQSTLPERYRFVRFLSAGAFGEVVVVRDRFRGAELALKVLKTFSKKRARKLNVEFKNLSNLNHPNLIRVYDYGLLPDGKPYFTMELIEGEDLRSYLRIRNNIKHLPEIIYQSLQALKYLHSRDILHGDIKPENVMVMRRGEVKFLDFGLVVKKGQRRVRVSGTPGYIAPEVLKFGVYTESSDLYALGVTFVESVLDKRIGDDMDKLYEELLSELSGAGLSNASSLSSFILSLCSRDREERPGSTEQAVLAFEASAALRPKVREADFSGIFVGRKRELRLAENFLKRKLNKAVLIVEGAIGSGKKALARQITRIAQTEGFITIELDGTEHISSPTKRLFEQLALSLEEKKSRRLERRVDEVYEAFTQHVGTCTTGEMIKSYHVVDLNINLSRIIEKYSKQTPVLLILKNVESFEGDFLSFIAQLEQVLYVDKTSSVLTICTLNSDKRSKFSEQLKSIREHELTELLELEPFSLKEVREFIDEVFSEGLLLKKEVELIYERTDGLPLLVTELAGQLVAKGLVVYEDGLWKRKGEIYSGIKIFSSADEALVEWWKSLQKNEKRLLRIIAFYDSKFRLDDVVKLTMGSADLIGNLVSSGILTVKNQYVEFVSPLFKETVIRKTGTRTKRKINYLIASYLNSIERKDIVRIARYFIESGSTDEAYRVGMEAARYLIRRNEFYLAYEYLSKLKGLLNRVKKREELVDVLMLLAERESIFDKPEEAIRDYEYIVRVSKNKRIVASALMNLGMLIKYLKGDLTSYFLILKKAYRLAKKIKDERLMALSLVRKLDTMKESEKKKVFTKALRIARKTDPDTYSIVLRNALYYYGHSGKIKLAEKYFSEAVSIIDSLSYTEKINMYNVIWDYKFYSADYEFIVNYFGRLYKRVQNSSSFEEKLRISIMIGGLYYVTASYEKMISALKTALEITKVQKSYYDLMMVQYNLLIAYKKLANYGKCLQIASDMEKIKKEGKVKHFYAPNLTVESNLYSMLGDIYKDKYKRSMLRARKTISKLSNNIIKAQYYHTLYKNNFYNLNLSRALRNIDKASSIFKKVNSRDDLCETFLEKSIILCELGEYKKARRYIKQAFDIYNEIHCEYLKPQLLLARGMGERMKGKAEAIETLREALKVSRKQLTREQTWQIQREMALYYRDKGQYRRALKYYKDAVETIKQITESIPTEEIKISYLEVPFRKRVFEEIKELKKQLVE